VTRCLIGRLIAEFDARLRSVDVNVIEVRMGSIGISDTVLKSIATHIITHQYAIPRGCPRACSDGV